MQLVVDKIAKAFGIHEIFKDVSFMCDKGEHLGLVGVNGSGKTTLLKCLLDTNYIDSGSIKFEPGIRWAIYPPVQLSAVASCFLDFTISLPTTCSMVKSSSVKR